MANTLLNLSLSVIEIGTGLVFDGYTLSAAPQTNVVSEVIAPEGETLTLSANDGNGGAIVLGIGNTISLTGALQGMQVATRAASGDSLLTSSDYYVAYTGPGSNTFTLPSVTANAGRVFYIKNRGTGTLTVARTGSDELFTTTNVTSFNLIQGVGILVISDGTYWVVQALASGIVTDS